MTQEDRREAYLEDAREEREVEVAKALYSDQSMSKAIDSSIEENIPKEIRDMECFSKFWGILGRSMKLMLIDEDDAEDFMRLFTIARNQYLSSIPVYEPQQDHLLMLTQLRIHFLSSLKRSQIRNGHIINERVILGNQAKQVFRVNSESFDDGTHRRRGFFGGRR